jgi:hypothetical protein
MWTISFDTSHRKIMRPQRVERLIVSFSLWWKVLLSSTNLLKIAVWVSNYCCFLFGLWCYTKGRLFPVVVMGPLEQVKDNININTKLSRESRKCIRVSTKKPIVWASSFVFLLSHHGCRAKRIPSPVVIERLRLSIVFCYEILRKSSSFIGILI